MDLFALLKRIDNTKDRINEKRPLVEREIKELDAYYRAAEAELVGHLRKMKKQITTIILILLATIFLVACRNSGDNNNDNDDGTRRPVAPRRDDSVIDTYIYRSNHLLLEKLPVPASGVLIDGERIVYWYTDSTPQIMVRTIAENFDPVISTRIAAIPADGWRVSVGGLQITEDGNIELVKVEDFEDYTAVVSHVIYDAGGNEIYKNDLTGTIKPVDGFIRIEQVVFTDDGNIAVVVKGTMSKNDLYLIDNEGKLLGEMSIDFRESLAKMRDGRVVISEFEGLLVKSDSTNLQVINFLTAARGDTITVAIPDAHQLLSAGVNQPFDILLGDGRHIYGYEVETNTLTPLLDWLEVGFISTYDNHFGVLPDNRFVILNTEFVPTGEDIEWYTDFYLLTRTSRADLPPKTTITVGGFFYSHILAAEVIAFNRENPHYQIEIIHPGKEDMRIERDRLTVEIIAGRGPDILFDNPSSSSTIAAAVYADLYQFIDADPELNRSDFFPSVLSAFERTDGTLPFIPRKFNIETNIALRETADRIGPLTFTNLQRMLDEPGVLSINGNAHIIGNIDFRAFIDIETNRAYFDSDEFISWLEMTARMPVFNSYDDYHSQHEWNPGAEIQRMRNGEQIMRYLFFDDPGQFRLYNALFGDITAVGIPTRTGGQHLIHCWEYFGINANSPHKDAAWEFLRRFLLPETPEFFVRGIPIRIDKYEEVIDELMTPNIEDGVEVPVKVDSSGQSIAGMYGVDIDLYAMTEGEATAVRRLIDNVSADFYEYDNIFWEITSEVTPSFFFGTRSAEETARILQNRIQRVLNERG